MSTTGNQDEPGPAPDDGGGEGRISDDFFTTELSGGIWAERLPGAQLPHAYYGTRLLTFPFCELRRIAPQSPIVQAFDQIDEQFSEEIRDIFERNPHLRQRGVSLGLEAAYTLASAFEQDEQREDQFLQDREPPGRRPKYPPPEYPRNLEVGVEFGEELARNTKNERFKEALTNAINLARQLADTPIAELLNVLRTAGSKET